MARNGMEWYTDRRGGLKQGGAAGLVWSIVVLRGFQSVASQ